MFSFTCAKISKIKVTLDSCNSKVVALPLKERGEGKQQMQPNSTWTFYFLVVYFFFFFSFYFVDCTVCWTWEIVCFSQRRTLGPEAVVAKDATESGVDNLVNLAVQDGGKTAICHAPLIVWTLPLGLRCFDKSGRFIPRTTRPSTAMCAGPRAKYLVIATLYLGPWERSCPRSLYSVHYKALIPCTSSVP